MANKLTPPQILVLRYLAAVPMFSHCWISIWAALRMHGYRHNANPTARALVRRGLAKGVGTVPSCYMITPKGIAAAKDIEDQQP